MLPLTPMYIGNENFALKIENNSLLLVLIIEGITSFQNHDKVCQNTIENSIKNYMGSCESEMNKFLMKLLLLEVRVALLANGCKNYFYFLKFLGHYLY